jgi:hypothetical protein
MSHALLFRQSTIWIQTKNVTQLVFLAKCQVCSKISKIWRLENSSYLPVWYVRFFRLFRRDATKPIVPAGTLAAFVGVDLFCSSIHSTLRAALRRCFYWICGPSCCCLLLTMMKYRTTLISRPVEVGFQRRLDRALPLTLPLARKKKITPIGSFSME